MKEYADLKRAFVKAFGREPTRKERLALLGASSKQSTLNKGWRFEQPKKVIEQVITNKGVLYIENDAHKRELSAKLKRSESVSGSILSSDKDTSKSHLGLQSKAQRYRGTAWSKHK